MLWVSAESECFFGGRIKLKIQTALTGIYAIHLSQMAFRSLKGLKEGMATVDI